MKARAKELKAEARASQKKADGEKAVLDKIAEMSEPDRGLAAHGLKYVQTGFASSYFLLMLLGALAVVGMLVR